MEDEEFNSRIRRHHRRLLPRKIPTGLSITGSRFEVSHPARLLRLNCLDDNAEKEELLILDGPSKYVNAKLPGNSDQPLFQAMTSGTPRYRMLRWKKKQESLPLLLLKSEDRKHSGLNQVISASNLGVLLTGGLTALLKIGALLLTRTFCDDIWPYLQVFSVCALSINPLKSLVPKVSRINIGPLQGLVGPIIGLTVARPLVSWGLPDLYRTARFWRRLLPIYCGYMKTKYSAKGKSRDKQQEMWSTRHEWGGERVHRLVLDLSGFYVKSAQILATKADFVPEPWIRRLSNHLDNAPPRPFPEVERSICRELGRCPLRSSLPVDPKGLVPLDAVFSEVETSCIAAASIAQVHGAVLKDGERVVIKVQHLGMEVVMKSDLRNIVWVAKFLEGQLPFDLSPVVREIQKTIPLEFDFQREMSFMSKIKSNLEQGGYNRIVCPKPVVDLCAKRLLVMQRLEGIPFTRILHPHAPEELKCRIPEVVDAVAYLVHAYGQMFLVDGVFHADPHAGNLLLLDDGRLGLIDFGQSKVLEDSVRKKLAIMMVALYDNKEAEIASALKGLGMKFRDASGGAVSDSTLAVMARIMFDTCYVQEATVSPMSPESILRNTPLTSFNQALWLVVRALVILRGLCYGLRMDVSACTIWRPYALKALEDLEHVSV
ncbi:hypothetical protein R1sor_005739 [Riccia sorocarpa]|uniref:Protein kinase domain-containing protein n=1 Tax=Riccia sorocarpa TaxID=122646 RepID=A0ABD3HKD3_9MARC